MGVNYPEDRAGIYFVVLFIISAIYVLDKIKWKYSGVPLLFFPITFLYSMNLSKTVVTPDQILSREFYEEIRSHVDESSSLQMYNTQNLTWAYYERSMENKIFVFNQSTPSAIHDLVVTRKPFYKPNIHTDFEVLNKDSITKNYILIQEDPLIRNKITEREVSFQWNANEFSEIMTFAPRGNENYLFNLKSTIEIDSIYNVINLVFEGTNAKGEQIHYS
jgi:hypothetical protein